MGMEKKLRAGLNLFSRFNGDSTGGKKRLENWYGKDYFIIWLRNGSFLVPRAVCVIGIHANAMKHRDFFDDLGFNPCSLVLLISSSY